MIEGMLMSLLYNKQVPELIIGAEVIWKHQYSSGIELSNYGIANYFVDFKVKKISKCTLYMLISYETNHHFSNHFNTMLSIFNAGFKVKCK